MRQAKPKNETHKVYSLIPVLDYLGKLSKGYKERMLVRLNFPSNGSFLYELPALCYDVDERVEVEEDVELLFREFPDAAEALWIVCW